jgi:membrane protein DedA with SNARE-associated domain
MMDSALNWLMQYGYASLFGLLLLGIVGLPVPDETLLVFSGYLISRGHFHPTLTFVAALLGSMCGISLSYWIGRTLGHGAVLRYGKYVRLTPQRMNLVHSWFSKTGEWLLTFGYFIPGVRHFTALVAGTSGLEFSRFARFAYAGALIWVVFFLMLGYIVGENWQRAMALVQRYTLGAVLVGILLIAAGWLLHRKLLKP